MSFSMALACLVAQSSHHDGDEEANDDCATKHASAIEKLIETTKVQGEWLHELLFCDAKCGSR
jgi:hypothetical protein